MASDRRYVLKLSCRDCVGIVAAVSGFVAEQQGLIVEARHHTDPDTNTFFLRQEILADSLPFDAEGFRRRFAPIASDFGMTWSISDTAVKKRVVILVSKQEHCLNDLLFRWRCGELAFDLRAVISNHDHCRSFTEWHGVPYHHVPVTRENKVEAFAEVDRLLTELDVETVVLARFMQILPSAMCERYAGRLLNIHHSFLPSFVGAKPYHQAYARGVKFVGATCHYVTSELDEGPILEQDAIRTNHADTIDELIRMGRDVEKAVLARGLRYHLEDRILLNGNKTVVFD